MEITGRITADATVKGVKNSDKQVTNFTVALNHTFRSKGETVEQVTYVECDYWFGEGVAPFMKKGVLVRVYGYPEISAYINKKNIPVGVFRLHVRDIELLSRSKKAVTPDGELVETAEVMENAMQTGEPVAAGEPAEEGEGLPF